MVEGGLLVTPEGVSEGSVVVRDGRVAAILAPGAPLPPGPRLSAAGRYVLPGLIDSHVHFRTPGLEHKETWENGSRAALAGGVTTVMDMPNTRPPSLDASTLRAKAALIAGRSYVDHRFHMGADPDHPEVLADLAPEVATSAKAFMAGHHTAPVVFREAHQLEAAFAAAARGGVRLVLHAEDQHVFDLLDSRGGDPESYDAYEPHRPRSGAIVAVAKVVQLVRAYGTRTHILHVSSAEETDLLVAAAAEGLPISFEVTGHHLAFTDHDTALRGLVPGSPRRSAPLGTVIGSGRPCSAARRPPSAVITLRTPSRRRTGPRPRRLPGSPGSRSWPSPCGRACSRAASPLTPPPSTLPG